MKLRRRKASQIAALAEMAADSDDDPVEAQPSALSEDSESDEEYGAEASKPQRRAPARRRRPTGPMRPDLVELVLREMGRNDLFPKNTLKALRLTSRGFKTMLDALFYSLSTVKISESKKFKELLRTPSTLQNMETFKYFGSWPLEVSAAAALMAANPSQLKKLELVTAGLAFDILLHSSLSNLTSLRIKGLGKKSKALEWLCFTENVWPLQELDLCSEHPVAHTVLVPALKRFQQLRKLTLGGKILLYGGSIDPLEGFMEDSFPELRTLELNINDPGRLGLLSKARLPALLHLRL